MPASPAHCCRICGATSYRRVLARDDGGAMRATDLYQCSGCSVVFADPKAWREGEVEAAPLVPPVVTLTPVTAGASPPMATGPNFATYGTVPGGTRGQ